VITPTPSNGIHRDVHLGWVVDIDDTAMQCLVEFDDQWRAPASASATSEFRLEANREERAQIEQRLKRSPRFAFEVGKRCGWRCAVCVVNLKPLLDAAHIRGVADRGSDDPRNGLILCKNHHAAFDARLINFHPETGTVALRAGITADELGITVPVLEQGVRPHIDALRWRWDRPVPTNDSRKK
jgi:putative restriction endonuclease